MDDLDIAIIRCLQKDARMPYTDIANALGVVEGTVRNRVSKLLANKILRLNGTIDPHRAGFNSPAFVFVSVKPGYLEEVAAELASIDEVSYLVAITGEADLLVEIMCVNSTHLMEIVTRRIHKIEGIADTRTAMILQIYKELLPSLAIPTED